jgi:hypothetical protein
MHDEQTVPLLAKVIAADPDNARALRGVGL